MWQNADVIQIQSVPELRTPTLLCAFNGWSDGSFASSGALSFLLAKWSTQRFAEVDPEQIYVYTTTRPSAVIVRPGERALRWPELAFHALRLPHAEQDLVLLLGPEPDLRWKECAETVVQFARRIGTSQVVTLGCFLATVPHRGAVPLVGLSAEPTLRRRLELMGAGPTDYQGPTAFTTALADAAARADLPAASIWAAAPAYLQGGSNPKIAVALLHAVEGLLASDLGLAELEAAGRDLEQRVDAALGARPDLQRFVAGLAGGLAESGPDVPEREEPPAELPSPQEFLAEMESFLKGLQRNEPEGGEPTG